MQYTRKYTKQVHLHSSGVSLLLSQNIQPVSLLPFFPLWLARERVPSCSIQCAGGGLHIRQITGPS